MTGTLYLMQWSACKHEHGGTTRLKRVSGDFVGRENGVDMVNEP